MENQTILVTGADHFISNHLIRNLVILGNNVKALVRYNYYDNRNLLKYLPLHCQNKVEIISGNLTNPEIINYATTGVNSILHLSTNDVIPYEDTNLRDFITENILGTFNLLEASKKHKVRSFIYVSTGDTYGKALIIPTNENQPTNPLSPQIAACIGAEKLVEGYFASQNLPTTIVRLFNPYGPMQSKQAIIPTIISQAFVKPNVLLGNMHPIRDFTYVDDIVDGLSKILNSDHLFGEKVNLGSGTGISIGDLAEKILKIMDKNIEILFDATRIRPEHQDVEKIIADITKANDLLDWRPRTSIEAGLSNTVDWFAEHLNAQQLSERI